MKQTSILDNTTAVLEMIYGAVEIVAVAEESLTDQIFMAGTEKQIALRAPRPLGQDAHRKDPFYEQRLEITDGPYMDTIHNLYDTYAIFAGHTFGTFQKYVDEHGIKRRMFSIVKDEASATHVYREIIWKRHAGSPELASQRLKNSLLKSYHYACRLSDNAGIVGGIDITVTPIVRGLEGLVHDYFEKKCLREFSGTCC